MTVIQRLLRERHPKCNPWGHTGAPRTFNPIYFYWCVTRQLGATIGVSFQEPPRPVLSTTSLFDEGDTAEEWAARTPDNSPVGGGPHAGEYIEHGMTSQRSHAGTLLRGYARIVVGTIVAYTNGKPKRGTDWHSDGSKLVQAGEVEVHRAGTAVTCGELKVIARVQDPRPRIGQSCRVLASLLQWRMKEVP